MDIPTLRSVAGRLILVGTVLLPGAASADGGWFATPAIAAAGIHDDNILFSPTQPQEDRILRVSPAIEAGYRSVPMTLRGRYTFDAERYARHTELDDNRVRENAALDFRYEPTRLSTLMARADYAMTQTPGELSPETGLLLGRARAERFAFSPTLIHRFDRLTSGSASYGFIRDRLAGGIGSDTHTVTLDLNRRIVRRDVASFRYRFDRFHFDTGETVTAHALLGGGTHEFTSQTTVTALAGPRFSDGSIDPEVSASLLHELERGEQSLTYTRSQTTVLGLAGPVDTESFGATFAYSPRSNVLLRAMPGYLSSNHSGLTARVLVMNLEAGYRIARYLTLIGAYGYSSQHGSLATAGFGDITRRAVLFGLVVAAPERTDTESRPRVLTPSTLFEGLPVTSGEPPQEEE